VFIGILRRKIGTDRIITEKGLGYRLIDPAEQQ
jgi:two-component system OmpR family response regulator